MVETQIMFVQMEIIRMLRKGLLAMLLAGSVAACVRTERDNSQSGLRPRSTTDTVRLTSDWAKEIGSWNVSKGWIRIINKDDPAFWANDGWQASSDPLAVTLSKQRCIAMINEFLGDPLTRRTPSESNKPQIAKLSIAICKIAFDDGDQLVAYFLPHKVNEKGWPRIEWQRLVCERARWERSLAKAFQGNDRYVRERRDASGFWGGTSYDILTITPDLLDIWQAFSAD